jgi:hypothetical protein
MAQIIRLSCSWCDTMNDVTEGAANYCPACGHRADVLRSECDCRKCKDTGRLLAIRERERERRRRDD